MRWMMLNWQSKRLADTRATTCSLGKRFLLRERLEVRRTGHHLARQHTHIPIAVLECGIDASIFHGWEPVFLELVRRPATNHFHPLSVRGAHTLFAQHLRRALQRRHSIPPDVVIVRLFVRHMHMRVEQSRDQTCALSVNQPRVAVFQAQDLGIIAWASPV